jgi:hypothetical protein
MTWEPATNLDERRRDFSGWRQEFFDRITGYASLIPVTEELPTNHSQILERIFYRDRTFAMRRCLAAYD